MSCASQAAATSQRLAPILSDMAVPKCDAERFPSAHLDVTDLKTANLWAEHNLAKALEYVATLGHDVDLRDISKACAGMTLSTCMSGTGGAEISAAAGANVLSHFRRTEVRTPVTLWACDVNAECRYELQLLPHRPKCIFTDVCLCLHNKAGDHLRKHAATMRYADLQRIMKHPKLATTTMPIGGCCIHPDSSCEATRATVHAAGTECPAWSSQGQHGGCSGTRVLVWVSWIAHRRAVQEPIIFHENVEGFPIQLLREELGDLYLVHDNMSKMVCPSHFGQPYERVRRLTLMFHKKFVNIHASEELILGSSFSDYCDLARRRCSIRWDVYFRLADDEPELQKEIAWSRGRPSASTDKQKPPAERPDRASWEMSDFDRALSDEEVATSFLISAHYLSTTLDRDLR